MNGWFFLLVSTIVLMEIFFNSTSRVSDPMFGCKKKLRREKKMKKSMMRREKDIRKYNRFSILFWDKRKR